MDITERQEKELATDRFENRYTDVSSLITFLIAVDGYITVEDILETVIGQGSFEYVDGEGVEMLVTFVKSTVNNGILFALIDLEAWGFIENIKSVEDGVEITYIRWGTDGVEDLPMVVE